jgi:uncharacterized protein YggE
MRSTFECFAALLLALTSGACTHYATLHADVPGGSEPPRGIVVSGQGEAKAPPDLARVSLGVESRAAAVEQATADANARANAIVAALKQAGIADADLRTHNFSINFEQEPTPPIPYPDPQPATRGKEKEATSATVAAPAVRGHYRVSNMLEVTVRDVSKVGAVIKLATDAGANNVWGVSFEIENPDALRTTARAQAIARARQNAEELARLGGVKLGKLVSMSESDGGGGRPEMKAVAQYDASSVPIEGGQLTVFHHVQLAYEVAD